MLKLSFFILVTVSKVILCSNKILRHEWVPRVINGVPAKLGEVPYQLAFKQSASRTYGTYRTFCGGVIIGPSKVLSAAHCFEERGSKCMGRGKVGKKTLARTMAVAGNLYNMAKYTEDSLTDGQWRKLRSMVYPRKYKFPNHDIAVGFTVTPFALNNNVAVIPYTNQFAEYKGECLASGYGRTDHSKKIGSSILLTAKLQIVQTSRCSRVHRRNMIKFVCTDIRSTDVGKGDSGGPLVCNGTGDPREGSKGILVGVVSGARMRVGTFFTRVSSYSNFIRDARGTDIRPSATLTVFCLIYTVDVLLLFCFI